MHVRLKDIIAHLKRPAPKANCLACAHFCNDPKTMEAEIPGLQVMGSGWASVRKQDGLCRKRNVYLDGMSSCSDFTPVSAAN